MPSEPFNIELEERRKGTVARLSGNADNVHADQIRAKLEQIIRQRTVRIVLDLTELQYIASRTLAELIEFRRQVQSYGGRIRLAGANEHIDSVFRQTRLVELFPIYPSVDEALAVKES